MQLYDFLTRNCEFLSHNSVKKNKSCEIKIINYIKLYSYILY